MHCFISVCKVWFPHFSLRLTVHANVDHNCAELLKVSQYRITIIHITAAQPSSDNPCVWCDFKIEALNTYSLHIRPQGRCADCRRPLWKPVCHPRNPSHVHFPGKQKESKTQSSQHKNNILEGKLIEFIEHWDYDEGKKGFTPLQFLHTYCIINLKQRHFLDIFAN